MSSSSTVILQRSSLFWISLTLVSSSLMAIRYRPTLPQSSNLMLLCNFCSRRGSAINSDHYADRRNSSTESSASSRMSFLSTLHSSVNINSGLSTRDSRLQVSLSSATSWTSHNPPDPHAPYTIAGLRNENASAQVGTAGGYIEHTDQGAGTYLLHVGAQFYEAADGGTQSAKGHSVLNPDHSYQIQHQWIAYNMAPMDRYQQQIIRDEPYGYGYITVSEESSGGMWDGSLPTVDLP